MRLSTARSASASGLLPLALLSLPLAAAVTDCDQCCSPAGSCSLAYKQTPGICCGTMGSSSFCCPSSARCFKCSSGVYRCYNMGEPSCSICSENDDPRPQCKQTRGAWVDAEDMSWFVVVMLFCCCCACARKRTGRYVNTPAAPAAYQSFPQYQQNSQPAYTQQPYPPQAFLNYPQRTYPQQYAQAFPVQMPPSYQTQSRPGFTGGTVAAAAGTGFLGGVLVGEAVNDSHHHGGGHHYGVSHHHGGGHHHDRSRGGNEGGDAGFAADN